MNLLLENIWICSFIVLIFQIIFVYLRTINVIYTSEKKIIASIITGGLSGLFWLLATTIGTASLLEGKWQPVIAHLIGGAIGTYLGIKLEIIKQNKAHEREFRENEDSDSLLDER